MRGEFSFISKEELTYNEGEFICPTCKRPLEIEDIEAKQREMQANFNANKAARLKANKEAGMAKSNGLKKCKGLKTVPMPKSRSWNKDRAYQCRYSTSKGFYPRGAKRGSNDSIRPNLH